MKRILVSLAVIGFAVFTVIESNNPVSLVFAVLAVAFGIYALILAIYLYRQ